MALDVLKGEGGRMGAPAYDLQQVDIPTSYISLTSLSICRI